MLETVICIQKKLQSILKREHNIEKERQILHAAADKSGVEKVLNFSVERFEYGVDSASGKTVDAKQNTRIIKGVNG